MERTELFLGIIAYTLIANILLSEGGDAFWFAYIPLYILVVALPIYIVGVLVLPNIRRIG